MSDKHYIAIIHKEAEGGYGASFPDVPGVIAVGDTLDEALAEAGVALAFAFEDWVGKKPEPRSLEDLREDAGFRRDMHDAVIAAVRPDVTMASAAE